jgi:hypothetical protein
VRNAHRKTLKAIFAEPVNGALPWSRIESLLMAVGCRRVEGSGSSVVFEKDGERVSFHRPHPRKEALRYRVTTPVSFCATSELRHEREHDEVQRL